MPEPHFNNAMDLDQWLRNRERTDAPPTLYQKQVDAANREAVKSVQRRMQKKARKIERESIADWLRLSCYDTLLAWSDGRANTCIHNPTMKSPEPCLAAAWKPGLVVCNACGHLLLVGGDTDKTCDGCGHICEGMPDDGIYPVSMIAGSLCFHAGACQDCFADMKSKERPLRK